MSEYQYESRPLSRSHTSFHASPPFPNDSAGSHVKYSRFQTKPSDRVLTSRPSTRDNHRSGSEGRHLPHLSHRRSRTEAIPLSSNDRGYPAPRRISQTSLEDVELDPIEEKPEKPNFLGGLFQGEQAAGRQAGIEAEEVTGYRASNSQSKMAQSLWSATRSQKRMTVPSSLKQVTSAFFTPKPQEEQRPAVPEPADDEFLNLDIDEALFPSGSAGLSPDDAFTNLQQNAEHVIRQLQNAYKLRTFTLHETLAEKQAQQGELEESRSRFYYIQSQLEEMTARVTEQDRAMKVLADELQTERQKRQEDAEAQMQQPEVLQKKNAENNVNRGRVNSTSQARYPKPSGGGTLSSDSGFESGDESIADSTVSKRNDYPNDTTATTPAVLISPQSESRSWGTQTQAQNSPTKAQLSPARPSAYDRVLKGISSSGIGSSFSGMMSTSRCSNCRGLTSSDAWNIVSVLKEENKALKNRMGELEAAVEDCITLVGG